MRGTIIVAALVVAPAALCAQASAQARGNVEVKTSVEGSHLSTDAQSQVDANIKVAREHKLPEEPIQRRVAEGEAKGATDAQIVAASHKMLLDLQASHDAMIRGGHTQPSDAEVTRGAQLLSRGFTSVQIETLAQRTPSDRSLAVAFDVLTSLQAQGKPVATAVAQVESQLAARAPDADLRGLVSTANAAAGVTGSVAAGATATGAATTAKPAGASATGAVTGAVSGVVGGVVPKKP
jgi:hypothetical protein